MCRRRATKKTKGLDAAQDVELGGSLDRITPSRLNDSNKSDGRGLSSGQALKTHSMGSGGGGNGSKGSYTPTSVSRVDSNGQMYTSPGRAMAMGEHQRGRSLSRISPGPQMYSTTPGRHRGTSASPGPSNRYGYDGSARGGGVAAVTPVRGGSRRGRQMYDQYGGPSWDEAGGRMTSRSPGIARSKSTGRIRRPPRSSSQDFPGEYSRGNMGPTTMTPGRRLSGGGDGRSHGRQGSSASYGPVIRRSKSERHEYSPSHQWARQEDDFGPRWEDRDMVAAVGEMERGRRSHSQRSVLSSSTMSKSLHNASDAASSVDRSRSRPTTPSQHRGYQSGSGMVRFESGFSKMAVLVYVRGGKLLRVCED